MNEGPFLFLLGFWRATCQTQAWGLGLTTFLQPLSCHYFLRFFSSWKPQQKEANVSRQTKGMRGEVAMKMRKSASRLSFPQCRFSLGAFSVFFRDTIQWCAFSAVDASPLITGHRKVHTKKDTVSRRRIEKENVDGTRTANCSCNTIQV